RDGEAEAAALGPGPGRVGLVEPVDHMPQHRFVHSRTVVADLEVDPVRVGGKPYRHRWLAVPQGVADQVREDDVYSARVEPCRDRWWKLGAHRLRPAPGTQGRAHQLGHVDLVQREGRDAGVEPADLDEVVYQPVDVERLLA